MLDIQGIRSQFPITEQLWYTPEQMAVILTLPPGTLTQRTLIYAVRIHPDRPASTSGQLNSYLAAEAESERLRTSRLLLCDLTARTIQKGLELLGIEVVERM